MKSTHLNTSRGAYHLRQYGNPDLPPLVCLHGWPETSYCWHHAAEHLKDHYHVLCPDLRGQGDSNRALEKKHYSKDQMALDILAVVDELGIDTFLLAGHDWGGGVAQEMALSAHDRIEKLVLLNFPVIQNFKGQQAAYEVLGKTLFYPFWYQFFQNLPILPEALIIGREDIWIQFFMRGMSSDIPDEAIQEYIRCYKIPDSITTSANLYRTMGSDVKRWKTYAGTENQVDTLIVHGILDPVIIPEYFEGYEDCFRKVKKIDIEAGHFVVDEQPQKVAEAMIDFFS